ncbi:MAG: SpoIIE family protein phosphatase, partial [Chlorobi bacterium]|nr:SpoIIE family protein phosphatase [Chlorobiota bacterium]
CPNCGKNTKWQLSRLFSYGTSKNEELKSLALFARHNPQPLFRVTQEGMINEANPASETLLQDKLISGRNLFDYLPEFKHLDFQKIIAGEEEIHFVTHIGDHYYNFVLKGVRELKTVHIYGNNITEIKLAEKKKIRKQAEAIDESIRYAWYIQKARIPDDTFVKSLFPSSFIFFRPRDIVSGDFYWVRQIGDLKIAAVADCTGHGVPGAMISMLGVSLLNEIILRDRVTQPEKVLNILRKRLISSLASMGSDTGLSDGMDIALMVVDTKDKIYRFAGAFNPLIICRNGENLILKADRMPVGKYVVDKGSFTVKEEKMIPGDRIYLFTDGYQDQFGKDNYKKFSSKAFRQLIADTHFLPMDEASRKFETTFDNWKQNTEQIDDVTVMCIESNF